MSAMHRLPDFRFLRGLTIRAPASRVLSVHATRSVVAAKGALGGDYCHELRATSERRLMTMRSAPPVVVAQIVTGIEQSSGPELHAFALVAVGDIRKTSLRS